MHVSTCFSVHFGIIHDDISGGCIADGTKMQCWDRKLDDFVFYSFVFAFSLCYDINNIIIEIIGWMWSFGDRKERKKEKRSVNWSHLKRFNQDLWPFNAGTEDISPKTRSFELVKWKRQREINDSFQFLLKYCHRKSQQWMTV